MTRLQQGLHYGIPFRDYLADPCEEPAMSASLAKIVVNQSLAHAHAAHPRLTPQGARDVSYYRDMGSLVHQLMLGGTDCVRIDVDSWRTNAAKEQRDEALESGLIPIKAADWDAAEVAATTITDRLAARLSTALDGFDFFELDGYEVTGIYRSAAGCMCKVRYDVLDGDVIVDIKTASDASYDQVARTMVHLGYDVQHAAYTEALQAIDPSTLGRVRMVFAFCEIKPPYAISLVEPDGSMAELGMRKWRRACELWTRSLSEQRWDDYRSEIVPVTPPVWALQQEGM